MRKFNQYVLLVSGAVILSMNPTFLLFGRILLLIFLFPGDWKLLLKCLFHVLFITNFVPSNVIMHYASETLYTFAVPSALADASFVPVLLKDKSRT